jgi:hypothetical protein
MKINININDQLELSLNQSLLAAPKRGVRGSPVTSKWWFARMRHIVNRAIDWRPAPLGRPEQIWFPNHQHHLAE